MSSEISTKQLAEEVVAGMHRELPNILSPDGKGIWSVFITGSYIRGDFANGNSDLDVGIIIQPRINTSRNYNPNDEPGVKAIRELTISLLDGRIIRSHASDLHGRIFNPEKGSNGIELMAFTYEEIPKSPEDIVPPQEGPDFPYFNVFMFDFVENLLLLWGNNPQKIMPDAPDPRTMAGDWCRVTVIKCEKAISQGLNFRIPYNAFKAIQYAQIFFGKRTLDKRELLELYKQFVPDFPMKDFGYRVITDKMEQRFPDNPPNFAPIPEYMDFIKQLVAVVKMGM